jgi:GntR family transcriptional regulator
MDSLFQINPDDPTPLYAQLERAIRLGIAVGRLRPDTQLPTVRLLAVDLRVNANTVAKVYRDLERAGLVETRRGVGTFIKSPLPETTQLTKREMQLRQLADRFLAEAANQDFTTQELLTYIRGRLI